MRCVNTPSATVATAAAVEAAASAATVAGLAAGEKAVLKLGSWRGLRATGAGLTALDVPSPPAAAATAAAGGAVPGATAAELRDETRGAALW